MVKQRSKSYDEIHDGSLTTETSLVSRRNRIRNPFRHATKNHHHHQPTLSFEGVPGEDDFFAYESTLEPPLEERPSRTNTRDDAMNSSNTVAVSEIEFLAQRKSGIAQDERFVVKPSYAYPKTKLSRDELRMEMNKQSSYFHDLTPPPAYQEKTVGRIYVEILQCFGLPARREKFRKQSSAFCILVCDRQAFKTDVMPPVANPMWLSKMRRACIFPLFKAYNRLFVGVFSKADGNGSDRFIGRVVIDMCRLRPGSTYDVTLPLRLSNQVYSRSKRGAVRLRIHLEWHNDRDALMSYLPRRPRFQPHDSVAVRCSDNKAFQNVARAVHGSDLPGKFSMKLAKATSREINFIRIHLLRYIRKKEIRDITQWRYPLISLFVFVSWMHSVYVGSLKYVPGNFVTYLLLRLWKNYAKYVIYGNYDKGFVVPTWEEMMGSLLIGTSIEPLQMERKEQIENKTDMLFSEDTHTDPLLQSLQEIAKEFRENVPRTKRRRAVTYLHGEVNTFLGKNAVDFLVEKFARTRKEAVDLGRRLQRDLRLFEHVGRKQVEFKDAEIFFVFSNVDASEYTFKTHKPLFGAVSRLLFGDEVLRSDDHVEFPFANGTNHPRFTVKDSVVIRSRESLNALTNSTHDAPSDDNNEEFDEEEEEEDDDDDDIVGDDDIEESGANGEEADVDLFSSSFSDIIPSNSTSSHERNLSPVDTSSRLPGKAKVAFDFEGTCNDNPSIQDNSSSKKNMKDVLILKKPPNQDINVVLKSDKGLSQVLAGALDEVHGFFGHLFHDKAYRIRLNATQETAKSDENKTQSASATNKNKKQVLRKTSSTMTTSAKVPRASVKDQETPEDDNLVIKTKKEQYDKLLRSGKYSSSNVIIAKIAMIVQPLVEISQTFLASFRALFNIFTWRDPFLTFWIATFGLVLVPILHIFPWRFFLGVLGILFVGPQNWIFRLLRGDQSQSNIDDFDMVFRKKKQQEFANEDNVDMPYFSSFAPDNRPLLRQDASIDPSDIKEVAVPHTQLMYRRCYDWPPEPEYARVWKCAPPDSDPDATRLLESDFVETFGGSIIDSISDHHPKESNNSAGNSSRFSSRARQIMNKSVASVKHAAQRRGGRKKIV